MDEEVKIPGMQPLPTEMPDDMKEHAAVRPQLQLCVWKDDVLLDGVCTPHIPQTIVDKYLDHADPDIRMKFNEPLAKATSIGFNLSESTAGNEPIQPPLKKMKLEGEGLGNQEGAGVPATITKKISDLSLQASAVLPSKDGTMKLLCDVKGDIYVACDETAPSACIAKYNKIIAMWWKGKWRHNKEKAAVPDTSISFKITSLDDVIIVGNKVMTVAKALDQRRSSEPTGNTKILYHTIEEETITTTHEMVFDPELNKTPVKKEEGVIQIMDHKHFGILPKSVAVWQSSLTAIVWQCQWHDLGLTPAKPVICLTKDICIQPGECMAIGE